MRGHRKSEQSWLASDLQRFPCLFTTTRCPNVDVGDVDDDDNDDDDDGDGDGAGGDRGEDDGGSSGELPLLPLSFWLLPDSIASAVAMQTITENCS